MRPLMILPVLCAVLFVLSAASPCYADDTSAKYRALSAAAASGNLGEINRLLAEGANLHPDTWLGTPPLIAAAKGGHAAAVDLLLQAGANLEEHDKYGENQTALIWAAANGNLSILSALISAGANLEARDKHGSTALLAAAIRGNRLAVGRLLEAGANASAVDNNQWTAAMHAWYRGRYDIVDDLGGVHANNLSIAQLASAVANGDLERVRELLKAGVNPNSETEFGYETLMTSAVRKGHWDIAHALLEAGAEASGPELIAAANGPETPDPIGQLEWIRTLLAAGADIRYAAPGEKGGRGQTALHRAAYGAGAPIVQALLDAGADINATDEELHVTPLMAAAYTLNRSAAEILLSRGADPNLRDFSYRTAGEIALWSAQNLSQNNGVDEEMARDILRRGKELSELIRHAETSPQR